MYGISPPGVGVIYKNIRRVLYLYRNSVSKDHIQPEYGDEQANAGLDYRTRLARPNHQALTRAGKYSFSLFS